ncbi:MAG: LD-carboxypeptidase [Flavobacteriales bacterium]|nr:LD-carboxypeptidase [Flavobacteriales bacterium]MCB9449716.1 LD-carboxypeptidase [Flavobacteriales bacterium]
MRLSPPVLQKGDVVGIAATARKVDLSELEAATRMLESWGLQVQHAPGLFESDHQFAGSDNVRAAGFQALLDDSRVKAILLARGGYGTVRMVDMLDFDAFHQHPKWIIGFSDATVLHAHIQRHVGCETLHAPMALTFPSSTEAAVDRLQRVLFGEAPVYTIPAHPQNRKGTAEGMLTGGNLSVLYSLLGSSSDADWTDRILFLEDLDEYLYHIDRMMVNLRRSGKLQGLAGLVVGGCTDMKDNQVPFGKTAEEIISDAVSSYGYPVCFGFPAGHVAENMPLIMGRKVFLEVDDAVRLTFADHG